MSMANTLRGVLSLAAALLLISACASSDDLERVEGEVANLRAQVEAAEARVAEAEATAARCNQVCEAASQR